MGNFWEFAKRLAGGVAFWAMLMGLALSQDDESALQPVASASQTQPNSSGPSPTSPSAPCRETGNSSPPNLALSPENWPSPSEGTSYDQFDPLQSQCPSKDDYFIIPPRNCWYFRAEGGAMHRNPSHNVDFAGAPTPFIGIRFIELRGYRNCPIDSELQL